MKTSLFTYVYNALSQGYPILECVYNLLPISNEVIIVDCGSNDGTKELIQSLLSPYIRIEYDTWINGIGGRNHRKTGSMSHQLCHNETIIYAEADEIWPSSLVMQAKAELECGNNNLIFWRYQLTQNFQRAFWYPERQQRVHRIFPKHSDIMQGRDTDVFVQIGKDAALSKEINGGYGYIVDCRNNFRDQYLNRENTAKVTWGEQGRNTTRMAPAHASYSWELNEKELQIELNDERWLWDYTIFNIPDILRYHLGKPKYEVRQDLVQYIKDWVPLN